MDRSFHMGAPLRSAVDELPYLKRLYAELQPAVRLARIADEIRDIRLILEGLQRRLAPNLK